MGAYSFVGELFVTESETFRPPPKPGATVAPAADIMDMMDAGNDQERERLKFNDNVAQGDLYKPWKPFKHPQFGDIEIGGWVKMSSRLPHPFMLNDLVHRNASAVLFAAAQTPVISLEVLPPVKAGADLYKIRVRVINGGSIPSLSYNAVQRKIHPQDMLKVSGPAVKVVAGGRVTGVPIETRRLQGEPTGAAVPPGARRRQARVRVPGVRQGRGDRRLPVAQGGEGHQDRDAAIADGPMT